MTKELWKETLKSFLRYIEARPDHWKYDASIDVIPNDYAEDYVNYVIFGWEKGDEASPIPEPIPEVPHNGTIPEEVNTNEEAVLAFWALRTGNDPWVHMQRMGVEDLLETLSQLGTLVAEMSSHVGERARGD